MGMGNQPIFTAHQQPIHPQVSQSVGHNSGYEFNSQPIQISQVPRTIPSSLNATAIPNLNTIPQSGVRQNLQPNTIAQSYVTQTLPQSLPTHHNHSVHNIPENTTLPILNPWQRQSMFDRKNFPQNNHIDPHLNQESDTANIRNNINSFENVPTPCEEPQKHTNSQNDENYQNEKIFENDWMFPNPDGTLNWQSLAMYYRGLANLNLQGHVTHVEFKNPDGSIDWKSMTIYYRGVASAKLPNVKNKPKGNYGKLDPPTLKENLEFPNCSYYEWKDLFMEFMRNNFMEDWGAVIFLKTKCLPAHHQQSISNLNKTSTIFSLLDTQYGSKNIELGKLKSKIIGDAPIANTLTFNMAQRLERVKDILKYLTIFFQHFK